MKTLIVIDELSLGMPNINSAVKEQVAECVRKFNEMALKDMEARGIFYPYGRKEL